MASGRVPKTKSTFFKIAPVYAKSIVSSSQDNKLPIFSNPATVIKLIHILEMANVPCYQFSFMNHYLCFNYRINLKG